ncbi:hypothetical protein [McMurdo Ice Shelf pond-associated circular DNA virus-8]|uniref:hypothetical protein n=1 Tax=McMurdo Ice Shelf pond-associated circular DNA virus-8 TaxID=1521392 RepID=UPI0004D12273|nr:hypothetical protein [McMurdo Ice Shelf pond-associated circular DNA virus-8]AIF71521.1 hypothetical protein [McMurdo Ice Shelf pond-associated circular DNA virus-8]
MGRDVTPTSWTTCLEGEMYGSHTRNHDSQLLDSSEIVSGERIDRVGSDLRLARALEGVGLARKSSALSLLGNSGTLGLHGDDVGVLNGVPRNLNRELQTDGELGLNGGGAGMTPPDPRAVERVLSGRRHHNGGVDRRKTRVLDEVLAVLIVDQHSGVRFTADDTITLANRHNSLVSPTLDVREVDGRETRSGSIRVRVAGMRAAEDQTTVVRLRGDSSIVRVHHNRVGERNHAHLKRVNSHPLEAVVEVLALFREVEEGGAERTDTGQGTAQEQLESLSTTSSGVGHGSSEERRRRSAQGGRVGVVHLVGAGDLATVQPGVRHRDRPHEVGGTPLRGTLTPTSLSTAVLTGRDGACRALACPFLWNDLEIVVVGQIGAFHRRQGRQGCLRALLRVLELVVPRDGSSWRRTDRRMGTLKRRLCEGGNGPHTTSTRIWFMDLFQNTSD